MSFIVDCLGRLTTHIGGAGKARDRVRDSLPARQVVDRSRGKVGTSGLVDYCNAELDKQASAIARKASKILAFP